MLLDSGAPNGTSPAFSCCLAEFRPECGGQAGGDAEPSHSLGTFLDIRSERIARECARPDDVAHDPRVAQGDRQPLPDDRVVVSRGIADENDSGGRRVIRPVIFVREGVEWTDRRGGTDSVVIGQTLQAPECRQQITLSIRPGVGRSVLEPVAKIEAYLRTS